MMKKIAFSIGLLLILFAGYVSTRPNTFHYERSGLINASPEKIFPYLNNFRMGGEWSPYEKMDTQMKKTYSGAENGAGAVMEFEGKPEVGSGRLEILKSIAPLNVELKLEMTKPFKGTNLVTYQLSPEGTATRFTWSMSGDANFISKIVGIFIDCEKMVGDQFSRGIQNLKSIVEVKSK